MPNCGELSVCVAIPTYNRGCLLVETIEQVLLQDPPADEVLVIDQTKEHAPETDRYLERAAKAGRLRWIKHSPPNLNSARNRAIAEATCDILILIDDDVKLVPSFIAKHAENYKDETVVAVAGRTIQANGHVPISKAMPWLKPLGYDAFALDGTSRIEGVACFIGANHSVRVPRVRAMGGYDANYRGPLFNESDLALELVKGGGKIVFDPRAEVYHGQAPGGGVRRTKTRNHPEYWMSFSAVYFYMKHFFPRWHFWQQVFFVQFRRRVLYRDNFSRPWRIPWAVVSYVYSIGLAAWLASRGALSSLRTTRLPTQRRASGGKAA